MKETAARPPGEPDGGSTPEGMGDEGSAPVKRGPRRPPPQPLPRQPGAGVAPARGVLAQRGFHGATIERVARRSGTPRPTVYELFGGKDELFAPVGDEWAEGGG